MATLAARFPRLKAYLCNASRSTEALYFEQLLGFLYAVSSAPDVVEPSEWMPFVFADGFPASVKQADKQRLFAELMELYNMISEQVVECRVELPQGELQAISSALP